MANRSFRIVSLGCFRNTYDSQIIAEKLTKQGYKLSGSREVDLLIINTCGFIDKAKEESVGEIISAVKEKEAGRAGKIIIAGCLVSRYKKELSSRFREVDEFRGVLPFSRNFEKSKNIIPGHLGFLKISEGCLNRCSYCAIPLIKGPLVSKPEKEILKELKYLDDSNVRELNIIGQDITSWGKDLPGKNNLESLLEKILKKSSIPWIRLLYTHPSHFSDGFLKLIAAERRICKYIDLPIQHINDRILTLMNRKTKKKEIINIINKIRAEIPECALRTSLIAGFPTETEKEFKELLNFIKKVKFERLGVFSYSKEENTPAYSFRPQIPYQRKQRRFRELMSAQKEITEKFTAGFVNKIIPAIVDEKEKDYFIGRTRFDAYEVDGVVFIKRRGLKIGGIYDVKITAGTEYDLIAE